MDVTENLLSTPEPSILFYCGPLDGASFEEGWVKEGVITVGIKCIVYDIPEWSDVIPRWVVWHKNNPDMVVQYEWVEGKMKYKGKVNLGTKSA